MEPTCGPSDRSRSSLHHTDAMAFVVLVVVSASRTLTCRSSRPASSTRVGDPSASAARSRRPTGCGCIPSSPNHRVSRGRHPAPRRSELAATRVTASSCRIPDSAWRESRRCGRPHGSRALPCENFPLLRRGSRPIVESLPHPRGHPCLVVSLGSHHLKSQFRGSGSASLKCQKSSDHAGPRIDRRVTIRANNDPSDAQMNRTENCITTFNKGPCITGKETRPENRTPCYPALHRALHGSVNSTARWKRRSLAGFSFASLRPLCVFA